MLVYVNKFVSPDGVTKITKSGKPSFLAYIKQKHLLKRKDVFMRCLLEIELIHLDIILSILYKYLTKVHCIFSKSVERGKYCLHHFTGRV